MKQVQGKFLRVFLISLVVISLVSCQEANNAILETIRDTNSSTDPVETLVDEEVIEPTPTSIVPTNTPNPTPTSMPLVVPTPTEIPLSVLPVPTPTPIPALPIVINPDQVVPTPSPMPNNSIILPVPTPTVQFVPLFVTPTPIPSKYQPVTTQQVVGTADLLDFTAGPTVTIESNADEILTFTAKYVRRDLGTPTVVQLWQRNGDNDAVLSDAEDNDCSTEAPAAFIRKAPDRGMKYPEDKVLDYSWEYCMNGYRYKQKSEVPWLDATTWSFDTAPALETFTVSVNITSLFNKFDIPGKYVLVIFAGDKILSEKVVE